MSFETSGSILSVLNERSRVRRAALARRLLSPDILLHFAYVVYAVIPLVFRLTMTFSCRSSKRSSCALFPFPGILIKIVDATWKATVPLRYMLWPPNIPERRELMTRDQTGIWRPTQTSKIRDAMALQKLWAWMDVWELLILLICLP